MMDWLGKMLKLPEEFLAGKAGEGGGVIQVRHGNPAFCFLVGAGIKGGLALEQQPLQHKKVS